MAIGSYVSDMVSNPESDVTASTVLRISYLPKVGSDIFLM